MTGRFPLLTLCNERQLEHQSVVGRLHAHGIAAVLQSPPDTPCVRFRLSRPDGVMICRMEASTWADMHLPALAGLDWQGMDPATMAGLTTQPAPLHFTQSGLGYERAEPIHDGVMESMALPMISSVEGPVWIERMDRGLPPAGRVILLPPALRVRLRLHLARLRMPLRRLRRLQRGDIVLLADVGPRVWCGTRALFDYTLHPETITVNTLESRDPMDVPPATAQEGAEAPALLDLASLPLTLDVSLGQLHLSLAELSTLQPGSVLPLPALAYQQLQLQHDGQTVASGELVQVGDRLGVQLTRVARLK